MAGRRPWGMSVHDWQHQLILEREAVWLGMPKRKGVDKIRRREAYKKFRQTLEDHLRACHGDHTNLFVLTHHGLKHLHEGYHEDD